MSALALLASGEGMGFQTVLDACRRGELDAVVVALGAEKKCKAVLRAEAAGVPVVFHTWGPYKVAGKLRATYERDLAVRLRMHGAAFILLDGWARPLTWGIEEVYPGRILDLAADAASPEPVGIVGFVRDWLAQIAV
ncbi:MAG TPA: formyltransferase family protein [Anaerolineales bacterium]|nr:formyltransferase family protein [Anaerolineales bacterium]